MHENFGRLLAVGYLGFDVQVDEDGVLGAPVATQDILTSPSNSVKRLNPSLSTASRQVVESVVIDLYQNVIEPNSVIDGTGNSNHHFAEAKRLLDAFGDGIRIATNLVEQERRSSSKDVPPMLQPKGTNSIKQTMAVQNLLGFNRYIYYKSAIEGSLTATKDQLVADPNDKVALGLQKQFAKCADQLAQEYKASQHVNLALKRFYLGLYE
jgi:ABC-type enterochelin transport system ATPase subunit